MYDVALCRDSESPRDDRAPVRDHADPPFRNGKFDAKFDRIAED